MVGQLLYELFTHGCHPYTELYGYSLDYVLEFGKIHKYIFNLFPQQQGSNESKNSTFIKSKPSLYTHNILKLGIDSTKAWIFGGM